MVDLSAIAAALSSLKAAKDIAESMIGLRDTAAFQGKLIEFQSKIIDANNAAFAAQDERSALLEKIRELEKQVTDFKAWEAEKQRYQMEEVWRGAFTYVVKEEARGAEPIHWICAACYQQGKKTVLQVGADRAGAGGRLAAYTCPACRAVIGVRYDVSPSNRLAF